MFSIDLITNLHDFTQHLTSGVLILIQSAEAHILVTCMACVDCVHVQLKTLSSHLKHCPGIKSNCTGLSKLKKIFSMIVTMF